MTDVIKVDSVDPSDEIIKRSAAILKSGGLVVFPTETVYGLGANALDEKAVKKIFVAKNRPQNNPLIMHVSSKDEVIPLAKSIPNYFSELADKFWPGPLTLILEKNDLVPSVVSPGLSTFSVRIPDNEVALSLIREAKVPVAAPSANSSTKPSPTSAEHVVDDLFGKVDIILDAGPTTVGIESTVLDLTSAVPTILRPGAVSLEDLKQVLPEVVFAEGPSNKSPGNLYKHYSPSAKVVLVLGNIENVRNRISDLVSRAEGKVAVLSTSNSSYDVLTKNLGSDFDVIANNLFSSFRELDKEGVQTIFCEPVEEAGKGVAIMNRLRKAASEVVEV